MTAPEQFAVEDLATALRRPFREKIAGPWLVSLPQESAQTVRRLIEDQEAEITQLRQHLNPTP